MASRQLKFVGDLDNPAAVAADKFIEAKDELDKSKKDLRNLESSLIHELTRLGKFKATHRGRVIEIQNTDPKQKIKVKDVKRTKNAFAQGAE